MDEGRFRLFSDWVYTKTYTAADPSRIEKDDIEVRHGSRSPAGSAMQEEHSSQSSVETTTSVLAEGKVSTESPKKNKRKMKRQTNQPVSPTPSFTDSESVSHPTCVSGLHLERELDMDQCLDSQCLKSSRIRGPSDQHGNIQCHRSAIT